MAATGEERVVSELKACRESLGQIRNELSTSLGQFQLQVTGLRESLNEAQQNYRGLQNQLDQLQQSSTDLEIQVQAARNLDGRLEQVDGTLQRVELEPLPTVPTGPIEGLDPVLLRHTLRTLSAANSQEEILDAFLELAGSKVDRAILFASKNGSYIPWRSRGFSTEALDSVVVDDPSDPIMVVARNKQLVYREQAPAEARPSLGEAGDLPHAFVAIPLVFDEFVPVIFYADSGASLEVDYLEILSYLAVLILKNNALQQLATQQPGAEAVTEPSVAQPAEQPVEQAAAPPPVAVPAEEPGIAPEPPQPEPEPEPELEPPVPPPVAITEDWEIPPSMQEERTAAPTPPPVVVQAPIAEPVAEPVAPPPVPPRVEPPAEPIPAISSEEQEKYNNEARRFARLLVSEIKLYNEDEVFNGRQNGDLYMRLKRDIDRSREMYEKRVHAAVARTVDHFHEELVRILAREDATLMGSGYPGPILRK
ncbi:MAG: hypothetical protein EHM61_13490 [Acidobacteria bacterium]|nr:MAG: hypothetical protein EHM61_13490 [Acidobacteriota bacterium]